MGTVKRLGKLGQDSTKNPFPTDWKTYINTVLVKTYFDQPNIARMMADNILPLQYDGKTEAEVPSLNDIDEAVVGMQPGVNDVEEDGGLINVKTPQIYITAKKTDDEWKQLFAGRNRKGLLMERMGTKIKSREDLYTFRGKTGLTSGIISDATDLGDPTGVWGAATNGKLTNALADVRGVIDTLDAAGVPNTFPVDIALTTYAHTLLESTDLDYKDYNNLEMVKKLLRGGNVYSSNNIQASVTAASNTMFVSVRAPKSEPGWMLYASGFDYDRQDVLWGYRVGIRQKVAYKIYNASLVYKMDGISTSAT